MVSVRHVLAATDFGRPSTRALDVAAEIASRFGAKLSVLHVIEGSASGLARPMPPEVRQSASFQLNELVRHLRGQVPAVEGILRQGFAWSEITRAASEIGADLVVIASHGFRDGHRFLIGSVADKVCRVCPVPVLTVHAWLFEDRADAGRELAQVLLQSNEDVRAVVALSSEAVLVGVDVAEAFGSSLHLLPTGGLEREGGACGAVGEDAASLVGRREEETARPNENASAAHAERIDEPSRLRRLCRGEAAGAILLVSDAILAAGPLVVGAQVLRRMGARRLLAAAPVASVAAREALRNVVDEVFVVQMVEDGLPLRHVYRDLSNPSDEAVSEHIAAAAEWARAVRHGDRKPPPPPR